MHADLSPSNIIVSDADGTFQLIDLGRNYLYTHAVTGTTGGDAAYVAPEVEAGDAEIARADLYSVAQLLILVGCGRPSADGVVPDIFYMRATLLARFIEDLIDASPARRLLIFSTGPGPHFSFASLKSAFLTELDMVQASEGDKTDLRVETGWSALRELLRPLAGDPGKQWRLWQMRRTQGAEQTGNRMPFINWLLAWSFVAAAAWAITNATVVTWLLRDFNSSWGNSLVELIQHLSHNPNGLPIVDAWRNSSFRARLAGQPAGAARRDLLRTDGTEVLRGALLRPDAAGHRPQGRYDEPAGPGHRGDHADHVLRAVCAR